MLLLFCTHSEDTPDESPKTIGQRSWSRLSWLAIIRWFFLVFICRNLRIAWHCPMLLHQGPFSNYIARSTLIEACHGKSDAATRSNCPCLHGWHRHIHDEIELSDASIKSQLNHSRLGMETFITKIGLSILSVMGFSSLRDELPQNCMG